MLKTHGADSAEVAAAGMAAIANLCHNMPDGAARFGEVGAVAGIKIRILVSARRLRPVPYFMSPSFPVF